MKTIGRFLALAVLILLTGALPAQAAARLALLPGGDLFVAPGQKFTVILWDANAGLPDGIVSAGVAQPFFTFDSTFLSIDAVYDVKGGSLVEPHPYARLDRPLPKDPRFNVITQLISNGKTSAGSLIILTFTVLPTATPGTQTTLSLDPALNDGMDPYSRVKAVTNMTGDGSGRFSRTITISVGQ